jgi:hypothetical protein
VRKGHAPIPCITAANRSNLQDTSIQTTTKFSCRPAMTVERMVSWSAGGIISGILEARLPDENRFSAGLRS